jgi:hypothetical protein
LNIKDFAREASIATVRTQLERVRLLAFFYLKTRNQERFTVEDVVGWFDEVGLPKPNKTLLRAKLGNSRLFVGTKAKGIFRLHPNQISNLELVYPDFESTVTATAAIDLILPHDLLNHTRGFLESLLNQINLSFEQGAYDGCAMLMRRLVEILLILAFRKLGVENQIFGADGDYVSLKKIIGAAVVLPQMALSKRTKDHLSEVRELGNLSAHSVEYSCKRSDIANRALEYRAAIEELAYKAGVKT